MLHKFFVCKNRRIVRIDNLWSEVIVSILPQTVDVRNELPNRTLELAKGVDFKLYFNALRYKSKR